MDINSLLSPSETPQSHSATPPASTPNATLSHPQSPYKHVQRSHSGSSAMVNSPLGRSIQPASSIPAHVRSPSQQPPHSSPLISPVPAGTVTAHLHRSSSAPSSETLADFMPSKATPPLLSRDSNDSQKSSSGLFPHLTSAGATSNPRTSIDINMVDTPKQTVRADYSDTSLPVEKQQRLAVLAAYLQESPTSYESLKEIIQILHEGFINHIYPPQDTSTRRDPRTYDLLTDLRQARENLEKLFALGEEQWADWLQDESLLAQTVEERLAVVESCRRAVTEEYGSTRLWTTFGDWILHCHKWTLDPAGSPQGDVDLERLTGREFFDWTVVLETWEEAVERTKHKMNSSHEVWNKYMAIRFGDLDQKLSSADVPTALELFEARLQVPHLEWQQTFQAFSSFVSVNEPADQYEAVMASTLKGSANAKKILADRDTYETALSLAQKSQDTATEYQVFSQYIEWERNPENKARQRRGKNARNQEVQSLHFDMVDALYQRAELRFPSVPAIWEEHIEYLIKKKKNASLLETLARATKHCPWSGSLWKQYLLASELAEYPFVETEKIKHKATSTGLLDASGIEETLLVHDAWCGYLLRRSKRPDATEEDSDVADMGIRSSIEAVHSCASKLGVGGAFDPSFRLQRKYVEYLKSQGRLDQAAAQFDDAVADYGKSYKFWLRYYEFELRRPLQMALLQRVAPDRLGALSSAPFAVGTLKRALEQRELDYPEPIMEALLNHCEDYEDAEELQIATSLVRKVRKTLAARQQQAVMQASEIAAQAQQAEEEVANRTQEVANGLHIGKRKREESEEPQTKRQRSDDATEPSIEKNGVEEVKRDREHASVLVQNIPQNVTETQIRQYFSKCGIVKHLKLLQDDENSVIVEFEEADAANFALSRNGVEFEGAELSIVLNTGSTLFVTNYPATADDAYIRNLFRAYGEVVNVRFPSLLRNKKRRFCYVEFKRPNEAQAATEMDSKDINGLALEVKISNPAVRQERKESTNQGRQVFVGQLSFKAKKDEVETMFSKYGTIEFLKIPPGEKQSNHNRGIAFLTFSTAEEAQAALTMNGEEFKGRKITVKLAGDQDNRSIRSLNGRSKSPSSQPDGSASKALNADQLADRQERTVAVTNLPDTVNQSRVRAAAEKIGRVRKVILKTSHQGALIEFDTVADAGRAEIELDNLEIDPGRHIRVTTEKEMLQKKPEVKIDQFSKVPTPKTAPVAGGAVRRPTQPGVRKKGGNLGMRSTGLSGSGDNSGGQADGEKDVKKSNDDFRNMLNKS
ncbi:Splicing factor [Cladophialophora chaetospira]|uniref:U4/U6 snRNA-associated-splicing factor PRP24 n=1 Tax=Cladophialophora chaetospira TaxID=386627 RepID=A0AA38WZD1_9EURO|nr:Splicing factor [Cladophialophora chaetospira]